MSIAELRKCQCNIF